MSGFDMAGLLKEGGLLLGAELTDEQLGKFSEYMNILLEWNKRVNLTAVTDPEEIARKHFLDSLALLPELPEQADIIDVGTGAGFPGVPLMIARPGLRVTLLDSLGKRVAFLEHVLSALGLEGARCVHGRAEDTGHNPEYRQAFDVCVSRAVANLTALAEYCLPFVKCGGKFISMKGKLAGTGLEEEINGAKAAISELGGEVLAVRPALVPCSDISHCLVIVSKLTDTPAKYPRKAGKIKKTPIL